MRLAYVVLRSGGAQSRRLLALAMNRLAMARRNISSSFGSKRPTSAQSLASASRYSMSDTRSKPATLRTSENHLRVAPPLGQALKSLLIADQGSGPARPTRPSSVALGLSSEEIAELARNGSAPPRQASAVAAMVVLSRVEPAAGGTEG